MRQKYVILKDLENNELIIREFAELDKESLSLLYEEKYGNNNIKSAIERGKEALISILRTQNLYPPNLYIIQIADSVISMYKNTNGNQPIELTFDDNDYITKDQVMIDIEDDFGERPEDIDELLDEDIENDFEDTSSLDNLNSSLKIADDDAIDIDDDLS